eukprot:scaffold139270_cov41-Prasinocladus_malaysianus.AAC.1
MATNVLSCIKLVSNIRSSAHYILSAMPSFAGNMPPSCANWRVGCDDNTLPSAEPRRPAN